MRKKLKEIAVVSSGQSAPQGSNVYSDNGIPFVKAGNLHELLNGKDISKIQKVSNDIAKKYRLKLFKKGTILFAKSGMSCLKGYVYILPCDAYVVNHLACVTPKEDISDYLCYLFNFHKPNQLIKDSAYPSISLSDISNISVNLVEDSVRLHRIRILDGLHKIIFAQKKELLLLDKLIKARFVELFGDPLKDDVRYPKVPLGSIADVGSSKRIFEKEYVNEGVPFYRTKEIVELSKGNRISTELFITRERYDEIRKNYGTPKTGDLLISAVGTIGVIWIVDGQTDFYYKDGNLLHVAASKKFVPVYLKQLLESLISAYKLGMSSGTAYAALTITALKEMLIFEAPIDQQQKFAAFVSQIDKSKVAVQKSLEQTQLLFDSLMQEYFG